MVRSVAKKVMWVGRATVFLVGLAVIVGLVLGLASMALGADGDFFKIGRLNEAASTTTLDKSGAGPALNLRVDSRAPLAVDSATRVTNFNADKLDGKNSTELGQMWAVVRQNSTTDCTLLRGSGATGTTGSLSETFCTVNFSRDLTNCAFIAGLSEPGGYPGADVAGEVWAFLGSNTSVAVRTADSAGAKTAKNFHVAVFC